MSVACYSTGAEGEERKEDTTAASAVLDFLPPRSESSVGFASLFGPWSTRADRWGGGTKMCLQVSGGGDGGKTGAAERREAAFSIIGTRVS